MSLAVEIVFDCLPLRSVGRLDIPFDASPKYRAHCERVLSALENYGSHNSYYLYNGHCTFRLTNHAELGMIELRFNGVTLTDDSDQNTVGCHLEVDLARETCPWLTEPIVAWFKETVTHSVRVEFDRYIAAGDLKQTVERIARIQADSDHQGGFVGMGL
jgi:hypothetical protein